MSKNITIQEGGVAKQLTANKLKTNLVGGGTCLWVPEDETTLGTKTITKNGTYKANDDGYYGYEQVVVNIANVGTATGTDDDGDEVVAHPTNPDNPENPGPLITEKVPSKIVVTTPPTKTTYAPGESINTAGMVVKAYLESGGEYGTVPLSQITIEPTVAQESVRVYGASIGMINDVNGYNDFFFSGGSGQLTFVILGGGNILGVYAADSPGRTITWRHRDINTQEITDHPSPVATTFTKNEKTVYYRASVGGPWIEATVAPYTPNAQGFSYGDIAWALIYGDGYITESISVKWNRPLDNKTLETSFGITVNS